MLKINMTLFKLIYFSLIVNHAQISSWNQPVLRNESNVSCSRKNSLSDYKSDMQSIFL